MSDLKNGQKAYPFRYPAELEKDIETIQNVIGWRSSKNKAISGAVQVTAAFVRKFVLGAYKNPDKVESWTKASKFTDMVEQKLGIRIKSY